MATLSLFEFLRKKQRPSQMLVQYLHVLHDTSVQHEIISSLTQFEFLTPNELNQEDAEAVISMYTQLEPVLSEMMVDETFWSVIPETLRPALLAFFKRLIVIQPELELQVDRLEWQKLATTELEKTFSVDEPVYTPSDLIYLNPNYQGVL
jgi:hypothetical protein